MSPRKKTPLPEPTTRPPRASPPAMAVLHPNAAGIDVHADMHMVCVPAERVPAPAAGDPPAHVRRFGANSCDLAAIADWLRACGVTTVAMESTGVYWIPLFELLEARGFDVWLVEPGQLSRCGARPKTDVLDAQWIQRLHSLRAVASVLPSAGDDPGLARLSPPAADADSLCRQPCQPCAEGVGADECQADRGRIGRDGPDRSEDHSGDSRRRTRTRKRLAALRDVKCKNDQETVIAKALEGTWQPEHLFEMKQAYELYQFHHRTDRRVR